MIEDQVILVDESDKEIGLMPKLEAHQKGLLHRAFSIFIFNSKGEVLLQQRANEKYHSAGLWSNTCCSHPFPGESILAASNRRLMEEMGLACTLIPVFSFVYKAAVNNGLIEHEYDHVLFGITESLPHINKEEVLNWKYMDLQLLSDALKATPNDYTPWLRYCINKVMAYRSGENN